MIQFILSKKGIICLLISLPFLMGGSCQKRKFSFVSNTNINTTYNVDETGSFTKIVVIHSSGIRKFLDDLPEDAVVTDVKINALKMSLDTRQGNTTTTLELAGLLGKFMGGPDMQLWYLEPGQISGAFGSIFSDLHINQVFREGINSLKSRLVEMIKMNDFGSIDFVLSGTPNSVNARTVADIHITVDIQIEYEQCIEVWDYLDGGAECDLED